jgi:hypothetical protein
MCKRIKMDGILLSEIQSYSKRIRIPENKK